MKRYLHTFLDRVASWINPEFVVITTVEEIELPANTTDVITVRSEKAYQVEFYNLSRQFVGLQTFGSEITLEPTNTPPSTRRFNGQFIFWGIGFFRRKEEYTLRNQSGTTTAAVQCVFHRLVKNPEFRKDQNQD